MRQRGLFEEIDRLHELTNLGDPLVILRKKIDWESFREELEVIRPEDNPENVKKAGRKPFDVIMMFRIMILQRYYNLSDDQMEFQLKDRRSFERFVSGGETLYYMPDAKTIWLYRERFKEAGVAKIIFHLFQNQLQEAGLIGKSGKIVDASFVEVPRQRNSRDENKDIKEGITPEDWSDNKQSQKDTEARWTKKNNEKHYGYKNHVVADKKSKLILDYTTTSAEVHDSQPLDEIIGESRKENEPVWGDSAYRSEGIEELLRSKKYKSKIHEKGYRNHPLTERQKENNTKKSNIRVRVEHIFGMIYWMKGDYLSYIGKDRVTEAVGMINLIYNMRRYCFLTR
jgi:transposase, IS5 family